MNVMHKNERDASFDICFRTAIKCNLTLTMNTIQSPFENKGKTNKVTTDSSTFDSILKKRVIIQLSDLAAAWGQQI